MDKINLCSQKNTYVLDIINKKCISLAKFKKYLHTIIIKTILRMKHIRKNDKTTKLVTQSLQASLSHTFVSISPEGNTFHQFI
jgi:hypothetical protein